MLAILEARKQVRLHAGDWAAEAIETYGAEADRILRSAQRDHGLAERYAFQQARKAVRRRLNRPGLASHVGAFLRDVILKGPTIGAR
jgi:hypothetical protein